MQILLNADPSTDGSAAMSDHLSSVVNAALGRFGERVTRVEAHLSDANGRAKTGTDDIHCMLDARLIGEQAVVVSDSAATAHQAIAGAVNKLKRAVGAAIAKHHPRHQPVLPVQP